MAYEKQTWVTGDTITANKLNHMEDGIDNADWKSESITPLFNETVTVTGGEATLQYDEVIDADTLNIVFNDVSYTCTKNVNDSYNDYGGGLDYPFGLSCDTTTGTNYFYTNDDGEYTVSASAQEITYVPAFTNAVSQIVEDSVFVVTFTNNGESITADKTITEVREAYLAGKTIIGKAGTFICTLNDATTMGAYFEFSRLSVGESVVTSEAYHYYRDERTSNIVIKYYSHNLQLETNP